MLESFCCIAFQSQSSADSLWHNISSSRQKEGDTCSTPLALSLHPIRRICVLQTERCQILLLVLSLGRHFFSALIHQEAVCVGENAADRVSLPWECQKPH